MDLPNLASLQWMLQSGYEVVECAIRIRTRAGLLEMHEIQLTPLLVIRDVLFRDVMALSEEVGVG